MVEIGVEFDAMASPCELRLVGDDEPALRAAAASAIDEVRRIERKYSRYRTDSVTHAINAGAGSGRPVAIDDETAALLDFADRLHAASDGLFDLTAGVWRLAWDFRAARVPGDAELDALRPRVGWSRVRRSAGAVELPAAGMELDFGGIGKEYAADRAAMRLLDAGVRGGWINLGGDLRVLGPAADGSPWRLGIRHPRRDGALLAEVELACGALATSGDYERGFEHEGRRLHHLLHPATGRPVLHWASVSVIAPTCAAAGALATIAMLRGAGAVDWLTAQHAAFLAVDLEGHTRDGGFDGTTIP